MDKNVYALSKREHKHSFFINKILLGGNMEEKEIIKTQQDRIRINISTSVKGIKTYDCTVETHEGMAVALQMSDTLIEQLDERYPAGGGL